MEKEEEKYETAETAIQSSYEVPAESSQEKFWIFLFIQRCRYEKYKRLCKISQLLELSET
jgi:hypothetical protein